jgi:hypothetical protein
MPIPKQKLGLIIGQSAADLKQVRIPGIDKPFEQMTIGELTQLRQDAAKDNYSVEAIGSDATITTSSILAQLGKVAMVATMKRELILRTTPRIKE